MDIYNKTVIASRNGDFLTTIEELARFVRRVLDFKSMQRASLYVKDTLKNMEMPKGFIKLMSKSQKNLVAATTAKPVYLNNTSAFSRIISGFTGLVDGSFKAKNITNCRNSLILLAGSLQNMSIAMNNSDENNTVYFATRGLKYFHPSAFACYYSGRETYETYL